MARIISPARNQFASLRAPLTPGERQVLAFFHDLLPPAWEIYVQPHLNGLRPDFVLLNPFVGIAVYEVKDWNLDAMEYYEQPSSDGPPVLRARKDGKIFRVNDNPLEKVCRYKEVILSLYCPRLGIQAVDVPAVVSAVTAGVIMTATTIRRAAALLRATRSHLRLDGTAARYYPIAGQDALARRDLLAVFPSGRSSASQVMDEALANDFRSWLVEPDFAATQRRPLELDRHQRTLVMTRAEQRPRRIKGPAGCGKSTVLAGRAAQLSAEGKDVLVVTYNITLWHYLRDLAVRHEAPGRRLCSHITWVHFHEWCFRVCVEADMREDYRALWRQHFRALGDGAASERDGETALVDLIRRCFAERPETIATYDAILVDEGQDFNLDWWNCLKLALRPGGERLLVADETQDLYERARRWTDDAMLGADFAGPWTHLTSSYRMPPQLVHHLRDYVEEYLPLPSANVPDIEQREIEGLFPVKLRWIQVMPAPAVDTCVAAVLDTARWADPTLLAFTDITLLVESNEFGRRCVALLQEQGVRCAHVFGKNRRERRNKKQETRLLHGRCQGQGIHGP